MFRFYRRWGAAPRLEIDPSFRFKPRRHWVGSIRGLGGAEESHPIAMDMSGASGLFAGHGLIDQFRLPDSTAFSMDGEEAFGELAMLFWLNNSDYKEPLEAVGEFDATHTELSGDWTSAYGEEGMFFLRRI